MVSISEVAIKSAAILSFQDVRTQKELKRFARNKLIKLFIGFSSILNDNGIAYLCNQDNLDVIDKILNPSIVDQGLFLDCPHFCAWVHRMKEACSQCNIIQQQGLASCFLPYFILPLSKAYPGIMLSADIHFMNKTIYPYGLTEAISINSNTKCQLVIDMPKTPVPNQSLLKLLKFNSKLKEQTQILIKNRKLFSFKNVKIELSDFTTFPELSLLGSIQTEFQMNPYTTVSDELYDSVKLLEKIVPDFLTELSAYCKVVLPYCMDTESWKSKTIKEVLYAEGISFKPLASSFLLAEELVHETAHTKFELLHLTDKLIEDDGMKTYNHPWRNEKRTLTSMLIASHAFLAVSYFYSRAQQHGFLINEKQLKENLQSVAICIETLNEHAQFTDVGRKFYNAMVQSLQSLIDYHFSINIDPSPVKTKLAYGNFYQRPFEYALLNLNKDYYSFFNDIHSYLKNTNDWNFTKTDFYAHWELQFRADRSISQKLFSKELLSLLHKTFESTFSIEFCPFLSLGAHRMDEGHNIGIHSDKPRALGESHRMVISINTLWNHEMGGYLVFLDSENSNSVRCAVPPEFGKIIAFKCANSSYHAVSTIKSGIRLTIIVYGWECNEKNQEYIQAVSEEERERIIFLD